MDYYSKYLKYKNKYIGLKNRSIIGGARKSRAIVVSGPSGVGKDTIINEIMKRHPDSFIKNISYTSRDPRGQEQRDVDYHFKTIQEMKNMIEEKKLLEYSKAGENIYGSSTEYLDEATRLGKVLIFNIDVFGAESIQKYVKESKKEGKKLNVKYIFIRPKDINTLYTRLKNRGTENEEQIQKRINRATTEINKADTMKFDIDVINDNLQDSISIVENFLIKKKFI